MIGFNSAYPPGPPGGFDKHPEEQGPYGPPPFGHIKPGGKHYASETRAAMARDMWEDYQRRFEPIERELVDRAMNPDQWLDERLSQIRVGTDNAFSAVEQGAARQRERYGISRNHQQNRYDRQNLARGEAQAEIDAINKTRSHYSDRNMAVIGGGGGGTRNAIVEA